jgi:ElaA protein
VTFEWQWCTLAELPAERWHAVAAARQDVFIVEQACAYADLDELDSNAEHLIVWSENHVAGYLRLLAPGTRFAEPSFGRVLTTKAFRGTGLGRELVLKGLQRARERYAGQAVRISAQAYLEKFYASFGFVVDSERHSYLEDGIPHMEMVLLAH